MNSTPAALVALCLVSLAGAGAAIYIARQAPAPQGPTTTVVEADTAALEKEIADLRSEVAALRARIDAVEAQPEVAAVPDKKSASPKWETAKLVPEEDEKLAKAVEAVLEEKGVEYVKKAQRQAKREGARSGMTKWVRGQTEKLPDLYDRIANRMKLDRRRGAQVEEIIDTTFTTMNDLTDQLYADPPPSEEESYVIMGEIKGSVETMVNELDEVLEDDELVQLGEITLESELPAVGKMLIQEGRDNDEPAADQSNSPR